VQTVYVHVDGDAIDRGGALRARADKHSEDSEDADGDWREPVDDRPDLDSFKRAKQRQGRDPGSPRPDGGHPTFGDGD
jgi:hypothetical protein